MPTSLTQISSLAWEHPADRAALNTLRALPGFDDAVRRVAGFFGERGVRNLFLANAVLVGPQQRPKLHALYNEVLETLDWAQEPGARAPQLYVTQTPFVNAGAIGFAEPFIVLNSAMLGRIDPTYTGPIQGPEGLLAREEQRFILAHELGHIMSGHTTYRTIAIIILMLGVGNLPFLAGLALLPFQLALLEWYRKAEFSADRAGLLGTQDLRTSMTTFLKMAGGDAGDDSIDLDTFLAQAAEYETGGTAWDTVLKTVNTALRDHPFHTVRVAELQRWVQAGGYDRIMAGEYARRGDPRDRPLGADYAEAANYYGEHVRAAAGQFTDAFGRARDAFSQAFRGGTGPGAGPSDGPTG
jgi:Zn-dependent protease with chaperone function